MKLSKTVMALLLPLCAAQSPAQDLAGEVAALREALTEMKTDYETRIEALEARLAAAEAGVADAGDDAEEAFEIAEETAIRQSSDTTAANTFNPAIGVMLVGRVADVSGGWEAIPGFLPGGELGPGRSGFSLGESELNMKASIDTQFYGNLTLALEDEAGETEIGVEEAWIQTTGLGNGLTGTAGRFFSGVGYLNKFHRHADDFVDRPLPYQAFFGGQHVVDGLQARWIAPTPLFLEFGSELGWGSGFPATANGETSPGNWSLFAKLGGDLSFSHSWQVGLSYVSADVNERGAGEEAGPDDVFSGDSDLAGIDFIWKWAPEGNNLVRSFKLAGEYFRREEEGTFAGLPYDGDQDGWYLQGVYQFRQGWRAGFRHDAVSSDNGILFAGAPLADPLSSPERNSVMLDWSPSEYSRWRLQYTHDRVLDESESQFFIQYLMSLGAHGAHEF